MKNLFVGVSAIAVLASFGAAAQQVTTTAPFTVSLGLDYRHEFGYIDDDRANANDREMRVDYRLIFEASAKADNGLEYGAWLRIRNGGGGQPNGDGLRSDYKYIWAQGSWGRVELGDNDGAQNLLGRVYAPTVGIGQVTDGTMSSTGAWGLQTGYYTGWGFQGLTDDAITKATYLTPKFAGFQAGISYAPEIDTGNRVIRLDSVGGWKDLVELGLNYNGTFGGFSVQAGGSYAFADGKTSATDDVSIWTVGAQVGYAGFAVGAGFFSNGEMDAAGFLAGPVDDQWGWNAGISYSFGPFGVAAQYAHATTEPGAGGELEDDVISLGATYQLAPGLSLNADLYFFDNELGGNDDGTLAVLRTRIKF